MLDDPLPGNDHLVRAGAYAEIEADARRRRVGLWKDWLGEHR